MKTILAFCLLVPVIFPACAHAVDMAEITKELGSTGVQGWIHGAVADRQVYVFTYRNPKDFFDYVEMSLVPSNDDVVKQLAKFNRHDKVLLKGSLLQNPSPQPHVMVSSITEIKVYQSGYPTDPYDHKTEIPADLQGKESATFLVHAVAGGGQVLVLEYGDQIVPMFVKHGELTKNLYRGDLVQLAFVFQHYPHEPPHLNLSETAVQPVQVLESVLAKHGKPAAVEGALILFPKSPEIIFNVFAVQELLAGGLSRQYTLVNFDNPDVFKQIREKLQKAWDAQPTSYVNGRNKLVSTKVRIRATGVFNEVDPNQANAQILLNSADSIQILP